MAQVRIVNVPKLDPFSVKNLLKMLRPESTVFKYLPDPKAHVDRDAALQNLVPRKFLINVINTLEPSFFQHNIPLVLRAIRDLQDSKQVEKVLKIIPQYKAIFTGNPLLLPKCKPQ